MGDLHPFRQQIVGDDSPMATPPECFRAHDGDGVPISESQELLESTAKGGRGGIVRIVTKGGISPKIVVRRRSRARPVSASPERGQMSIRHPDIGQRRRQDFEVELRIRSRAWDRAYVDEKIDGNEFEPVNELDQRERRVSNRVKRLAAAGPSGRVSSSAF